MDERQLHRILPQKRDLMVYVCACVFCVQRMRRYESKSEREKHIDESTSKLIINSTVTDRQQGRENVVNRTGSER